jgi:Mg2+ and Co2+ transporter CorA
MTHQALLNRVNVTLSQEAGLYSELLTSIFSFLQSHARKTTNKHKTGKLTIAGLTSLHAKIFVQIFYSQCMNTYDMPERYWSSYHLFVMFNYFATCKCS